MIILTGCQVEVDECRATCEDNPLESWTRKMGQTPGPCISRCHIGDDTQEVPARAVDQSSSTCTIEEQAAASAHGVQACYSALASQYIKRVAFSKVMTTYATCRKHMLSLQLHLTILLAYLQ